ncbi:MAG TPA: hypothetical protein VEJ18_10400 [Planctomycetota bacterium]|nr:hypothetical protein [Planctomycetota bacterium]
MDGKKVFFVGLVLLAVLFAVGVGLGAARREDGPRPSRYGPSGFERALGGLLKPMKPRAKLAGSSFAAGSTTRVGPSKDEPMRIAAFRIRRDCRLTLSYACAEPRPRSGLVEQEWPPEDEPPPDPERCSFVVLEPGGTFTFGDCKAAGHSGCRVFVEEE